MSQYNIKILQNSEIEIWNEFIEKAEYATIFHKFEWLKIAEKNTSYKLFPLLVYKGNVLICVFPLFFRKKYSIKVILSPPNGCGIPYLGPVIFSDSEKQYRKEKDYFYLMDEIFDFLNHKIGFDYIRITTPPHFNDIRPFIWNNFSVQPSYTYRVSLSDDETKIFNSFDKRIREGVRNFERIGKAKIAIGDFTSVSSLLEKVRERYQSQGRTFKLTDPYINDLLASSLKSQIHTISAHQENELVAGSILLSYNSIVQDWVGAFKPIKNIVGLNEVLHWELMKSFKNKNYKFFESIGANTRHLCDHKAKYNPDLIPYYTAEKFTTKGKIAFKLFKKIKN